MEKDRDSIVNFIKLTIGFEDTTKENCLTCGDMDMIPRRTEMCFRNKDFPFEVGKTTKCKYHRKR